MKPVKTTENERYVKPEVKDIASLSDGLVLHGGGGDGDLTPSNLAPPEGEGNDYPNNQ